MDIIRSPLYNTYYYRPGMYKVIRYNRPRVPRLPRERTVQEDRGEAGKLSQAYSRVRKMILQLGMCNQWDWFFTGTINPDWFDRSDLPTFYKAFSQWIRDQRKQGLHIEYLFIPERHDNGMWHIHGFLRGLPESETSAFVPGIHPQKLIDKGYLNWPGYAKKFGFVSLGRINDPVGVSFYVLKYVSKDVSRLVLDFGGHLYYCSIGLRRAEHLGFGSVRDIALDRCLDYHGPFCSCGFYRGDPWDGLYQSLDPDSLCFGAFHDLDHSDDTGYAVSAFTNVDEIVSQYSFFEDVSLVYRGVV